MSARLLLLLWVGLTAWAPAVRAGAIEVTFEDPCAVGKTRYREKVGFEETRGTAGDVTVKALEQAGVDFQGSREGIQSIDRTPTSLEAIEFESENVFRIHGWCYQVDGFEPGVMAGDFSLGPEAKQVRWFFGYARYREGNWEGYCNTDRVHSEYCSRPSVSFKRSE